MKYLAIITYWTRALMTYKTFSTEQAALDFIHQQVAAGATRGDIDLLDNDDDAEKYVKDYFAEKWMAVQAA